MSALDQFTRHTWVMTVTLLVVLAGAMLFLETVAAHDYSPVRLWDTSAVTPNTTNIDSRYATQINGAANDYTNNTDLTVNYCSGPCANANIRHYEADYGNTTWAARALYTPPTITSATIQWNGHWGRYNNFVANRLARHELGHVFGLDHGPACGTVPQVWAVMGCAQAGIAILHAHDKIDIDNKY